MTYSSSPAQLGIYDKITLWVFSTEPLFWSAYLSLANKLQSPGSPFCPCGMGQFPVYIFAIPRNVSSDSPTTETFPQVLAQMLLSQQNLLWLLSQFSHIAVWSFFIAAVSYLITFGFLHQNIISINVELCVCHVNCCKPKA